MRNAWREQWQLLTVCLGGWGVVIWSLQSPIETYHSPHSVQGQQAFQRYLVAQMKETLPVKLERGIVIPVPPIPLPKHVLPSGRETALPGGPPHVPHTTGLPSTEASPPPYDTVQAPTGIEARRAFPSQHNTR
ncbi:MAG: hypothetical protein ACKO6N_00020 [Myxococcota bacterium]